MPTRRNFSKGLLAGTLFSAFPPLRQPTAQERKDRSEIAFYSASRLSRLVQSREIGVLELLELYLERVERFHSKLNAIVWIDAKRARIRARAADRALDRGETWGPLHGVPMTVKDTIEVADMPTTAGNPIYRQHTASGHAPAVQRLVDALRQALAALRRAGVSVDTKARPDFSLAESHAVYQGLVRKVLSGVTPSGIMARRTSLQSAWQNFFRDYDILLTPVAPIVAFRHDHSLPLTARTITIDDREVNYARALSAWSSLASASHLPATTVPVGLTEMQLPVGIQILGPDLGDWLTLEFAELMEDVIGGFVAPGGFLCPVSRIPKRSAGLGGMTGKARERWTGRCQFKRT